MPFDPRSPFVTSGVRIGTPAVTTRGMREPEMDDDRRPDPPRRSQHVGDERGARARSADEVRALCARFPLYRHAARRERAHAVPVLPRPRTTGSSTRGSARTATSSGGGAHCERCGRRFTTYERVEEPARWSSRRTAGASRSIAQKIVDGLQRACEKRPVSVDTIEAVADRIERQLQERGEKEVASRAIGEAVMRELHDARRVAYVRFASVYRSFRRRRTSSCASSRS